MRNQKYNTKKNQRPWDLGNDSQISKMDMIIQFCPANYTAGDQTLQKLESVNKCSTKLSSKLYWTWRNSFSTKHRSANFLTQRSSDLESSELKTNMRNALIQKCKTKQAKSRDRNRATNLKEFGVSQRGRGRRLLCHDMIVTVGCFRRHSSNPLDNLHRMFQDLIEHRCTRTKGIKQQNLIEPKIKISRTK